MQTYVVELDCGHILHTSDPRETRPGNSNVWCGFCNSYVIVPYEGNRQWILKCETCDPSRKLRMGRDKAYAVQKAMRHMRTNGRGDHKVYVWWTGNPEETRELVTIPDTPLVETGGFPF